MNQPQPLPKEVQIAIGQEQESGLHGCTYGDTLFDSQSVCYGWNNGLERGAEIAIAHLQKQQEAITQEPQETDAATQSLVEDIQDIFIVHSTEVDKGLQIADDDFYDAAMQIASLVKSTHPSPVEAVGSYPDSLVVCMGEALESAQQALSWLMNDREKPAPDDIDDAEDATEKAVILYNAAKEQITNGTKET